MSLIDYDRYLVSERKVNREDYEERLMDLDKEIEELKRLVHAGDEDLMWYKNFAFKVRDLLIPYADDPKVLDFLNKDVKIALL